MIAGLIGAITALLLLFIFWRGRSSNLKERFERPKFQFLKNLGVARSGQEAQQHKTEQEKTHAKHEP
ncbi:hypothetical protein [Pseudacidobacterium ailaaui]|jgi:hypothetical protein|uniref:hypothetical protein n=1 Tax=Pseudacidobacterium ailaaui TaxID=1382359 RepID=UPI00047D2D13|nr:hypothetical protein [Pseudacidobacterium ailaaui]MBX6359321.1 hypothetical protein [Pseudacidobacterium ailaaui]MCL6462980.1 hypothetical protein [Pseudacidobacterium ailaaui]MDI3253366.1 hypothetical protein [Bacillota bacterium]